MVPSELLAVLELLATVWFGDKMILTFPGRNGVDLNGISQELTTTMSGTQPYSKKEKAAIQKEVSKFYILSLVKLFLHVVIRRYVKLHE